MSTPSIDVVTAYINIMRSLVGQREVPVNDGQLVRMFQALTGNRPPDPWCASAVVWVLAALLGTKCPVPRSAACQEIYRWAKSRGVVVDYPARGALMLFWNEKDSRGARYAHIGAVTDVIDTKRVKTIEGNTSDSSKREREGTGVFAKERIVEPRDAFCLWWLALEGMPS